jgi:hypothetical protein
MNKWNITCIISLSRILIDYGDLTASAGDLATITPVHSDKCEHKGTTYDKGNNVFSISSPPKNKCNCLDVLFYFDTAQEIQV